ncbi:para-nitrobenzyl esterase [Sinosporangium album]|uniref:Carboxylic ester hydrolase n=1 Tax=Sinosporangium album TaxID=504805 RepID=A0A1G8GN54_9ACTN|nr:carboxylesterase/lipase family protein [Sinosporangium album]SDH95802.1 para-nitrobenzyl esterase [Sinosporangium album]
MRGFRRPRAVAATVMAGVVSACAVPGPPVPQAGGAGDSDGTVVRTDGGALRGTVRGAARGAATGTAAGGHRVFRGIPYAAPPVGALRWRPPRPSAPWTGTRDAGKPGPMCAQPAEPLSGNAGSDHEDCLYLDVFAPRRADGRKPVMVWLHGGGFVSGSGADYDASSLVEQGDVVVVTVNYRLGVFGFFGYPGLPGSGTFGIEDQQAALRWVRRNIAAFGGDPGNVTLFGQSAGGMCTCAQLTAPGSAGLFHKAIVQSGACTVDWPTGALVPAVPAGSPWGPQGEVAGLGQALAARRGCSTVDCLRAVPAGGSGGLVNDPLAPGVARPAYGSAVLPENPAHALRAGRFHRVPVMMGTTRDEQRLYVAWMYGGAVDRARYASLLAASFGGRAGQVASRYPVAAYASPALAWAAATTDRIWSCPTLAAQREVARHVPTYAYEFADRDAPVIFPGIWAPGFTMGAYHGSELAYLFPIPRGGLNPAQRQLSRVVTRYVTRFARTGDPNGPGTPYWPRFGTRFVQDLAPGPGGIRPVDYEARHQCGFWESVPCSSGGTRR